VLAISKYAELGNLAKLGLFGIFLIIAISKYAELWKLAKQSLF